MLEIFQKRDPSGSRLAPWIIAAMVFLVPPAWWGLRQIELRNDVENWLPAGDAQGQSLAWFHEHFSRGDRVFVSWEGASLADPRIPKLAAILRGTPDETGTPRHGVKQVAAVTTPHKALARMERYGVPRDEALRRLSGVLVGPGRLLVQLTEAGRLNEAETIVRLQSRVSAELGLEIHLAKNTAHDFYLLDEAGMFEGESGTDAADIASDSDSSADSDGDSEGESEASVPRPDEFPIPGHDLHVTWRGMLVDAELRARVCDVLRAARSEPIADGEEGELLVADCWQQIGTPAAVAVALSPAGAADASGSVRAIRAAAERAGIRPDDLRLAGGPVAGSALNAEVKKVAWNAAAPWYQLHERSPLLTSALVSFALSILMLRRLRPTLLVMAVSAYATVLTLAAVPVMQGSMNMVLVVMPALLLVLTMSGAIHVTNYWRQAAAHSPRAALGETERAALLPCLLASGTTAIGLATLATSPLRPVHDFGIYSAMGCLLSFVVVLYGLPSLLKASGAAPQPLAERSGAFWRELAGWLSRHRRLVTAASLLIFAGSLVGLRWFRTETLVIRYFPDSAQVVQDYNFVEDNLTGVVPIEILVRFDADARGRANFLQRLEAVRGAEDALRGLPAISGAVSLADFQPKSEPPAADAPFLTKARYNRKAASMQQRVLGEDPDRIEQGAAQFVTIARRPLENTAATGDELWRITANVQIMGNLSFGRLTEEINAAVQSSLKYHPGATHLLTGTMPLFLRTQQAVLDSLIQSFVLSFALIALVMSVVLRSPAAGLLAMIPNVMPIGVVFGLVAWSGRAVDIGTMITASVAMGVAVDGTLHLMTWFRKGLDDGKSIDDALAEAMAHCGPALCQTSLIVTLGLAALASVDLLLVSRFGGLMAALVFAALVADLIVTPALLAGPLGRLLAGSAREREASAPITPRAVAGPHRRGRRRLATSARLRSS